MVLNNEELKMIMELLKKSSADECIAISQRFNVQAQVLTNRAEERIKRLFYDDDEDEI